MKQKYTPAILLLSITIILQSCVGYNIPVKTFVKPQAGIEKHPYYSKDYKNLPVYMGEDRPAEAYEVMVRITVTGNNAASREKLINKMKKEAAHYKADGLILLDEKLIYRETFDGISLAVNILSVFGTYDTCEEPLDLPVTGEYQSLEMEGIAYRYK